MFHNFFDLLGNVCLRCASFFWQSSKNFVCFVGHITGRSPVEIVRDT